MTETGSEQKKREERDILHICICKSYAYVMHLPIMSICKWAMRPETKRTSCEPYRFLKTATTGPSVSPAIWILRGLASWRLSGRETASSCVPSGRPGAHSLSWKRPTPTLWRSARTWSATRDDLTCEQNLHARHQYLLIHHARAA